VPYVYVSMFAYRLFVNGAMLVLLVNVFITVKCLSHAVVKV